MSPCQIVEVFASDTIPITWIDPNFSIDFNPKSVINLYDDIKNDYKNINNLIQIYLDLKNYEQPLLLKKPSLEKTFLFVRKIINNLN